MRSWQLAVGCLALLTVAGCRGNGSSATRLERENYELEAKIFELASLVKECRRENANLRKRLGSPDGDAPADSNRLFGSRKSAPGPQESEAPDFPQQMDTPAIEVPSEEIPADEFLRRFSEPNRIAPPHESPAFPDQEAPRWPSPNDLPQGIPTEEDGPPEAIDPPEGSAATVDEAIVPQANNTRVAAIAFDGRLTGGYNGDPRGGHEGIMTVVELRNADGRPLAAPAPMSVVVLDPALSGDAARVARWDLTAEEVARLYRKTPLSEGVHLEMVWPESLPIHGELHLFVRYTTDDGRRLEIDRPIEIKVPVLQAQLPLLAPPSEPAAESTEPATESDEPADRWQRRVAPAVRPPAREPVRTSLVPREKSTAPAQRPPGPRRRAPEWSPDRF